jgi:DNA-binding response OmpR family regulator
MVDPSQNPRWRDGSIAAEVRSASVIIPPERCSLSESQTNHILPTQTSNPSSMGYPEAAIQTGKLSVNLETRIVSVDDQPVHLTGKEYLILEFLSLRKGTIVTKEMLFNHVYRDMDEPEFKVMDVFICKLRKKLSRASGGDQYIKTVWGRGYILGEMTAPIQLP